MYGSVKGAVEVLTRYMAAEFGPACGQRDRPGVVAAFLRPGTGWVTRQRIEISGGVHL